MAVDSTPELDAVDWKLVELLQEDGRMGFAELGRRVSLSPPAVAERVRRLEADGVITGYRAEVDPAKLGYPMQAVIRIIASARQSEQIVRQLREIPEVMECQRVTGQDSFVVRVALHSVEHLEAVLHRLEPREGDTVTSVILNTPVKRRVIRREPA